MTIRATSAPSAYRARRYLMDNGVSLSAIVQVGGKSHTTWSLFLSGRRAVAGGREQVEQILAERGLMVPAWLWDPETPETAGLSYRPASPGPPKQPEVFMEAQSLSDGARERFGLFLSPFCAAAMAGPDGRMRLGNAYMSRAHQAVWTRLRQAAYASGFVAVSGAPGTGKSLVKARALADAAALAAPHQLVVITPANIERRRMTIGHIVAELIRHLTSEPIPQATNARDARLAELLLARHKAGDRVILSIDEAHELPQETLKDLKRLHEGSYGFVPLLGIVIVGQQELRVKLDAGRSPMLTEVALRALKVELTHMERDEIRPYLACRLALVGDRQVDQLFDVSATDEMARLPEELRTPLNLNNLAEAALNCAHARGWNRVDDEVIRDVLSASTRDLQQWGSR